MCGISGIVELNSRRPVDAGTLHGMNHAVQHRGPDAAGVYVSESGTVGFAHRRLKILDLSGGAQPMSSADRQVTIAFNGEIYNYQVLRESLRSQGCCFRTESDTEVILNAYLVQGIDCVDHLRGMFSFALHDARSNEVFLVRDRLGIKPLYYAIDQQRLVFGSEIKSLLAAGVNHGGVDRTAIDFFMSVGYVPGSQTLFRNIRKVLPGHLLRIADNNWHSEQYWDLEFADAACVPEQECVEELDARLTECVRLHLASDVPLGVFLSGGLDSSAMVAIASRLTDEPVKTFSVGYRDDPACSELDYARLVAKQFQTEHHEFILSPLRFFDSLDILLTHMEEPVVESAAVALYQLASLAREHVTVILSGEGGDEVLAGYQLYQTMPKIDQIYGVLRWLPAGPRRLVTRCLAGQSKWSKYWDWCNLPPEQRYCSVSGDLTDSARDQLFTTSLRETSGTRVRDYFHRLFIDPVNATRLQRMTRTDIKSWLPDDLLLKADKMTMATSLELRVPFLDHEVLEFLCRLPDDFRRRGGHGKYLLKRLMERYLPPEIVYRRKQGFPVPIATWFRGELFGQIQEVLLDQQTSERGYFQTAQVERLLQEHKAGGRDHSRRLFSLLTLELWHRKYVDDFSESRAVA